MWDTLTPPAEEERLNTVVFREGLRRRRLTGLLSLHLQKYPSTGPISAQLMLREARLEEAADPGLPAEQRAAALAEANQLLEQVIEASTDDSRRFEWRFELSRSLLYDEAERYFTNILYRGGSTADREALRSLTERALSAMETLKSELAVEYERMDDLSIAEFERMERSGYVEQIDRLVPQADYWHLWVLFYDALARDDNDPLRAQRLNRVISGLEHGGTFLETPHEQSGVQVPALLLAGMSARRLNSPGAARDYLARAARIGEGILDVDERDRIEWALRLGQLERVRAERDDLRFESAVRDLQRFRERIGSDARDDARFGLFLVAALEERAVHRARASRLEQDGRTSAAEAARAEAWRAVADLAERHPDRRDEVYAVLYANMEGKLPPSDLDPFEQTALLAGLLFEAEEDKPGRVAILDRAVQVGEYFLEHSAEAAPSLVPEVQYNLAVAELERGRSVESARRLLQVAGKHPQYRHARQAAVFAVEIAADLRRDAQMREHPELQALYLEALRTLVVGYPESEAAAHWRFHYAELLEDAGHFAEAANAYKAIGAEHTFAAEAALGRLRSEWKSLENVAEAAPKDSLAVRERAGELFNLQRDVLTALNERMSRAANEAELAQLRGLLARSRLVAAEAQLLPQVNRPAQALDMLQGIEETMPSGRELQAQLWRSRLLAYERLGRLEQAAAAIPAYVAADPVGAGPTLQALYESTMAEAERLRKNTEPERARAKAEVALLLAEQVREWARTNAKDISKAQRAELDLQVAEATLAAGRDADSLRQFEQLMPVEQAKADPRVAFGYAEALYRSGRYGEALPIFNRLALQLAEEHELYWRAMLRDLQSRTALGQEPADVLKVIEQRRYLSPGLGGPELAAEFEQLERENQRRRDQG